MTKKNVCIIIGATKDYSSHVASVLLGLKKFNPTLADAIHIYHDGISKCKQQQLSSILNNLIFIKYDNVCKDVISEEILSNYSCLTFARIEGFNLLQNYKTVIWLDLDILIQGDISGLLEYGQQTGIAMSFSDCGSINLDNFLRPVPGYDMYCPLYNAGMLVLRDSLQRHEEMTQWCYSQLHKFNDYLRWGEQGIFNILVQEFHLDVEEIDILRYVCHPDRPQVGNAAIVHSYGSQKFWNNMGRDLQFPAWRQSLLEWGKHVGAMPEFAPRVSVIMTVYKRSIYLDEAIASILAQTFSELELIVVVEYSEAQASIVEQLQKINDPRLVVICNKKRLGFAASLNVGLDAARGEYIARMDDDDYSVLERLQVQVDFLDAHPDIDIIGSYMQCFGDCEDVWDSLATEDAEIRVRLLSETQIYHPSAMMRTASLRKYGLRYDPSFFTEDYALWARAAEHCKFANIPRVLVRYRASGTNATANNDAKIQKSHIDVMRLQLKDYLGIDPTYDELTLLCRRINILQRLPDPDAALEARKNFLRKIHTANDEKRFYDSSLLHVAYDSAGAQSTLCKVPPTNIAKCGTNASLLKRQLHNIKRCLTSPIRILERKVYQRLASKAVPIVTQLVTQFDVKNKLTAIVKKIARECIQEEIPQLNQSVRKCIQEEISPLNQSVSEIHTHIDWVQRDILILLQRSLHANPQPKLHCNTKYPVAYDSPDHLHPVGTVLDHTRCPRFIRACEKLFPEREQLSFLDIGCSAGGIVWDAILRGHIGVGLEGSDISQLQQRAEWRLIPNSLFTCDISKPFTVTHADGQNWIFDVVSAWEVLEHLNEEGLSNLFNSLSQLMGDNSLLFCSVSQVAGGFTDSGQPLHQVIQPLSWWQKFVRSNGFEVVEPWPIQQLDFARGNGNPSVYYRPYSSYHEQNGDCELLVIKKAAK